MDDHNFLEGDILNEEVPAEADPPGGRARGPFLRHSLDLNTLWADSDL